MQEQIKKVNEPLMSSTLDQAALWLTEEQGYTWDSVRILDHIVRMTYLGAAFESKAITLLTAILPDDEIVGIYDCDQQVPRLVALRSQCKFHIDQALDLLERGEFLVSRIPTGEVPHAVDVRIQPHERNITVTRGMIRISRPALRALEVVSGSGGCLRATACRSAKFH